MHKVFKVLCLYLSLWIYAEARVEWYVGISGQSNNIHDCIILGEEGYWEKVLSNNYKTSLEGIEKDIKLGEASSAGEQVWKTMGRPVDLFKLSLQKQIQAEIYNGSSIFKQIILTIGAYVYRRDHVLVSLEINGGKFFHQLAAQTEAALFQDDVPESLRILMPGEILSDSKLLSLLNPYGTGRPYQYCDGKITLSRDIALERTFSCGGLMRVGSVVRKRLYGFVCLGVDASKMNVKVDDTNIEGEESLAWIVTKTLYADSGGEWYKTPPLKSCSLQDKLVTFDSSEFAFGPVGGIGGEFFMTRRASVRFQTTYTYWPSVEFTSNLGTHLKCPSHSWGFNLGLFFRF